MTKIKKHGFNIANLSIILLALSFYVSTVFDAGASQKKHEGAVPVRGTAETREDIGAGERERICSDTFIVCGDKAESHKTQKGKGDTAGIDQKASSSPIMVLTSCYTGVESHGKNGIIDGVSVATYRYPQGTWLMIDGIGKRRVDTVTAKRFSNRVDIWFDNDYDGCLKYGLQYRSIKVIEI